MLSIRLISTCVLTPITVFLIYSLNVISLSIFVSIICLISAWEWSKMMRFSMFLHKCWMYVIFGFLCIILKITVFQHYLCFNSLNFFKYIFSIVILWWVLILYLIFFYPGSAFFWKNSNILRFCFGILMILPFFWGTIMLRQFYWIIADDFFNSWWLLYIMTLIWINDSCAYIIGKCLGKCKILKKISPQKTWEGFIGGILISTGFSWLCSIYISGIPIKSVAFFVCSVIAIFSAVVGDFSVSMFKREAKIKDTGDLIPGHGGILDRIDSLIAAIPIFTCLILSIYMNDIIKIEIF